MKKNGHYLFSILFSLSISSLAVFAEGGTPVRESNTSSYTSSDSLPNRSANIFWINLKNKLEKHLAKTINDKDYKYEVKAPVKELTKFFGNIPNAKVEFSGPNLNTRGHEKVVYAKAAGERMGLTVKVWKYKDIWILTKAVKKGEEIPASTVKKERRAIKQRDEKMFFTAAPNNNVALTNISAWTPLKINMLRHAKVIQPGDMVTVETDSQMINIQFKCRAFNSADPGETVRLKCPEMKNKNPRAVALSEGRARLI